jgi:DNA-binding NarL/FixJ family response regulator
MGEADNLTVVRAAFPATGAPFLRMILRFPATGEELHGSEGKPDRHHGEMTLRILLADDHPVVRTGLRHLLSTIDGLEVVGEVSDGEAAVRQVQLLKPDVVLMDVRMPELDGVAATRRIRASVPGTAVLILTMYDDDATVFTAMQAGARGYLLKGAEQDEIVGAIRAVGAGQAIFGPGVAARMLDYFSAPPAAAVAPFPELTGREREILDLLASGRRTSAIAEQLFLSPKTVSNHLTRIFAKLEVADRAAAIIRARDGGLGQAP